MHDLAMDLVGAVRRGEISAWFQPQIDLVTRELVGAEALCRWRHPQRGEVLPAEFIPLAERSGLIDQIGVFMARQCCIAIEEWGIDVSVNVSPLQLEDATFTNWLEQQIVGVSTGGRTFTIEITEDHPILAFASVIRRLDGLVRLGVGIAVGDVRVGPSALKQARRLHATELKIDRALVADESATASLKEAVDRAHADGVRVVAEGVETPEQLERVARLGCDRAQGYLLGRPMPKLELAELVRAA